MADPVQADAIDSVVFAGLDPVGTAVYDQARTVRFVLALFVTLLVPILSIVAAYVMPANQGAYVGLYRLLGSALDLPPLVGASAQQASALVPMVLALPVFAWLWRPVLRLNARGQLRMPSPRSWWRIRADVVGIEIDRLFGMGRPPESRLLEMKPSKPRLRFRISDPPGRIRWSDAGPIRAEDGRLYIGELALRFAPQHADELKPLAARLEGQRVRTLAKQSEVDPADAARVQALLESPR